MNEDPNVSCANCKFYFSYERRPDQGECRRNAPRPAVVNINDGTHRHDAIFPVTNDLLWCGDFQTVSVSNILNEESVI